MKELLSCSHTVGEFKCKVNQEGVYVCYPWHWTVKGFPVAEVLILSEEMKKSNSCDRNKERKRRCSNSLLDLLICLVNNLRDKSFLHLDWLDHSSIAMCHLTWPGQDTICWCLLRYLWRKCQIIGYCYLIISRKHFLWTKWESRKITALCKGSQSSKTTLGHQVSEMDRSHLAVINPSELRTKRKPLKPLWIIQVALEFTFWLQFSSRHSVAWAIGAKILLIYRPFLWQETLSVHTCQCIEILASIFIVRYTSQQVIN